MGKVLLLPRLDETCGFEGCTNCEPMRRYRMETEPCLRKRERLFFFSKIKHQSMTRQYAISYGKERSKSSCKEQARIFLRRASLHGLKDISRSTNPTIRILWVFIFLGALGAAIFGCCSVVMNYREAPIVASYFIKGMPSTFPLPDFVICPFNRLSSQFLKQNNISNHLAQYIQLSFGAVTQHPYQRRALKEFLSKIELNSMNAQMTDLLSRLNLTFNEFLDEASLKCQDILVACTMPNGVQNCCTNATDVMTFTGKCYRIPATDQSGVGYGYGATLVISLPKSLYSLSLNNWLNDGVILQLAEPGRAVDYGYTVLSTGTHALMPLKAIRYEFMHDPPHFECLQRAEVNYSILDCFEACVTEKAENACQCSIVTKLKGTKLLLPACSTYQFYNCVVMYMQKHLGDDDSRQNYFYNCRRRCKPRCDYWQYQSSMSYADFPIHEAKTFTKSQDEWERMQNTIILDLYFEKLEYTLIKHHRSLSVHGFIANLGGQYSLWLGGSVLTLIQVIVFLIRYLYAFVCEKLR